MKRKSLDATLLTTDPDGPRSTSVAYDGGVCGLCWSRRPLPLDGVTRRWCSAVCSRLIINNLISSTVCARIEWHRGEISVCTTNEILITCRRSGRRRCRGERDSITAPPGQREPCSRPGKWRSSASPACNQPQQQRYRYKWISDACSLSSVRPGTHHTYHWHRHCTQYVVTFSDLGYHKVIKHTCTHRHAQSWSQALRLP